MQEVVLAKISLYRPLLATNSGLVANFISPSDTLRTMFGSQKWSRSFVCMVTSQN